MPALLEIQRAIAAGLVAPEDAAVAPHVVVDGLAAGARLNVYRNNFVGALTTALRLSFPAVDRLVGAAFFESAARRFIERAAPKSACLDEYGAEFPSFLEDFEPAAGLPYLPGVARLEWAVSRALHALDSVALDIARLAEIPPSEQGRIAFVPQPSIGLVQAEHPVDAIWRAVLARDDAAMAAIDLRAGPVWLLVERRAGEVAVTVTRCALGAWRFAAVLFAGRPLQAAIDAAPEIDAAILLADHLAAGRLAGVGRTAQDDAASAAEMPR